MRTSITRLYDNYDDAIRAAHAVKAAGVPADDVSIVANNSDGWYRADESSDAAKGAGTGAAVGAVAGGGAGVLAGLGMLAIPGLGPVVAAGWLAATAVGALAGAAAGGAAGGLVGAMTEDGVSETDAHVYAESVRRGGSLVTVRADDSRRAEIERMLDTRRPVDLTARSAAYRESGWKKFDAAAPAYTAEQVKRERSLYSSGSSSRGTITADRVKGTEVYNGNGDHLGEVEDVIIDKMSGKVAYAVMSFGGFLGIGEKYHPVPWSVLKYDTTKDGYIVPMDKGQLEKAPAYTRDEMRYTDRAWNSGVYDYYKAPPFWI